ncbi:hypothetical protein [Nonomuraea sp. NPDC046570]|uniref:hypothetical protein n=1 Tax=Nonomuraea sp. NPDC046570 TaxID=3155255 RepID=UPI0033E433A9
MEVESSICLSDLVPALRWSRPQQVAEVLADPRLPAGWWGSVAVSRALGTTGVDWVCERLARLAASRWEHLPLADLLPALHVHQVDPALPGWPEPARTVITGLGGWRTLRRLSPGDLTTPSATEAVVSSVFREVLGRIPTEVPDADRGVQAGAAPPPAQSGQFPQQGAAVPQAPAPLPQRPVAAPGAQPPSGAQPAPGGTPPLPQRPAAAAAQAPGQPFGAFPNQPGPGWGQPTATQPSAPGQTPPAGQPPFPGHAPVPGQPPVSGQSPVSGQMPAVQQGQEPIGAPPVAPSTVVSPIGESAADDDYPMVRVVDGLFRGFDRLELAVAVNRLFAADPVSLRTLAHKLLVDRDALSQAQRTAEERVLHWLRSSESAPVTGHMFRLTEWLGAAATEEQLIGADPAHPIVVPSLRTPLWRVLVTLMPDRRLQDGWLVVGDLGGLQMRTRQLLAANPADADVEELLAELGIRRHSAKAWLGALPSDAALAAAQAAPAVQQPLPRRTPGANGHHHRGGQPVPSAPSGQIDPSAALATLSALSGGRSSLLPGTLAGAPATPPPPPPSPTSDPRRWQRIEVTPDHLRGGPVAVPEGYAAQLGMRPGTLLSVTGPGDNAVVLVWRDHQPVFDSLQPVLMRLNARPGDQVYVTVDGYRLDAQLTS